MTADETLGWKTPRSVRRGTQTDISQLLQFQFWKPIVYLDTEEKYPSTKEKPGRWLGIAHNVGDFFSWKIYDEEKELIIERSVVNSRRHKPNFAVEQELKELFGIEQQGDCSSDSDISFAEMEQKGVTDTARRERQRERRKRRKRKKATPTIYPDPQASQTDADIDQALRSVIGDLSPSSHEAPDAAAHTAANPTPTPLTGLFQSRSYRLLWFVPTHSCGLNGMDYSSQYS
jgi:hypothetical protein